MHFYIYRHGTTIVEDSTKSEWIIIVKSVRKALSFRLLFYCLSVALPIAHIPPHKPFLFTRLT